MSKSNSTEIIAILWLIAGLLMNGWGRWVFFALAIENVIESMANSYLEHKAEL